MPERYNFVTSNIEDVAKALQLMEDAAAFTECRTLNRYVGLRVDLRQLRFTIGQSQ